jgi:L-threonylcarbamoyladenylate synthase
MYLLEGEAADQLPHFVAKALAEGKRVGVLCSKATAEALGADNEANDNLLLASWGESLEELAANLFYLLRDFDRTMPDVILAEGVGESGIGLAVMNRMRKAAGYQIVSADGEVLRIKNGTLPSFMLK